MTEKLTVEVNGNCRSCARLLDEVGHRMQEVARLKVELDNLKVQLGVRHDCSDDDRHCGDCARAESNGGDCGRHAWTARTCPAFKAAGETHHEP